MIARLLTSGLVGLALMTTGCWHNRCCAPQVRSASPCCPPGTAPAAIPGPPPGFAGYGPVGTIPAFHRR
ncbi:MAG: hypothetical protein ACRC33_00120 [Gemmataceae bacterium]